MAVPQAHQSEFFVSMLASGTPQKIKTSLCIHFNFVINPLLCHKFHMLFWSEMHLLTYEYNFAQESTIINFS